MSQKVSSALFDAKQLEISDSEQESTLATKYQLLEYALKKEKFESKLTRLQRAQEIWDWGIFFWW